MESLIAILLSVGAFLFVLFMPTGKKKSQSVTQKEFRSFDLKEISKQLH